jgi:hypothetical protein
MIWAPSRDCLDLTVRPAPCRGGYIRSATAGGRSRAEVHPPSERDLLRAGRCTRPGLHMETGSALAG